MKDAMDEVFGSLEWHDAELLCLSLDRRAPGERDEVVLLIQWPDGRKQQLRFTDCYAFDAQMNFGVIAAESILSAQCLSDTPRLAEIGRKWKEMGMEPPELRCFEIITNSTASELRVYAKRFVVEDAPA